MAGLSSTRIRSALGEAARVVRVMPNTPCQIGLGVSGLALGEGARRGDESMARAIFTTLGEVVDVAESQMYAVTAVSGSGPAYVFRLAELMERSAIELGLEPDQARALAVRTVHGAGALLERSNVPAAALREAVTSPGGTTAAALEVMEQRGLAAMIRDALRRARDRGMELDR
jgi:pyrroline-5-carboxylate reductase